MKLLQKHWIILLPLLLILFIAVFIYLFYMGYIFKRTEVLEFDLGWKINQSRNVSDYIFPDVITTIIPSKNICSKNNPPRLMIIVCSSTENFLLRSAIRKTWAQSARARFNIGILFLLGLSLNEEINKLTKCESEIHNDMVIENFIDTYNNLTLISLMMLKWLKNNCNNTSYFMKTDDDVYINMNNLVQLIDILSEFKLQNILLGQLLCGKIPSNVPKYMYQESTYPNFLRGPGYLMSMDVAMKLYREAFNISIFHAEDIYVTGLCSRQAGIQPAQNFMFQYVDSPDPSKVCNADDNYLVLHSHHISYNDMLYIHLLLNTCKNQRNPVNYNELLFYEC